MITFQHLNYHKVRTELYNAWETTALVTNTTYKASQGRKTLAENTRLHNFFPLWAMTVAQLREGGRDCEWREPTNLVFVAFSG